MTESQEAVLAFIKAHIADFGVPPSRSEICREMGWKSSNAAQEQLQKLAELGKIELVPGMSRGIRVL